MKIISFNISVKIDNSKKVVEYLKTQNADIVCLQEVFRPLETSVSLESCSGKIIINALKKYYPFYFFAPEWVADKFIHGTKVF